jgi:hypothetical protein
VDSQLLYVVDGANLSTTLSASPGKHYTVVEEWDYCGDANFISMQITAADQSGVHVTSPVKNSLVGSLLKIIRTLPQSERKSLNHSTTLAPIWRHPTWHDTLGEPHAKIACAK